MTATLAHEETFDRTFERLYRQHRRDVYRFVLRDLRNPDDAEDVTQAAFLNAYRALQHGNEPAKPRAWLLTIAQNVVRRRFRTRGGRPQEVELDPELAVAPDDEGPTAEEIRSAIETLRPTQRAALVLREIGGLSYAEVAEELDLSVSAVETLIFRARRAVRAELEAEGLGVDTRRRVRTVAGLGLGLPQLVADALAWLGRRSVTAKVAGAAGAAAVATGVAVQTGPLTRAGDERPAPVRAQQVAPAEVRDAPIVRLTAPAPRGGKAAKPPRAASASGVGQEGQTVLGGLVPQVALPGLALPLQPLPDDPAPPSVPKVPLPEIAVPLPEIEVPLPEVSVTLPD